MGLVSVKNIMQLNRCQADPYQEMQVSYTHQLTILSEYEKYNGTRLVQSRSKLTGTELYKLRVFFGAIHLISKAAGRPELNSLRHAIQLNGYRVCDR